MKPNDDSALGRRRLCTPDAFAKASLLHVQEMGVLEPNAPQERGRSRLQSFLFLFVENGEGSVSQAGRTRALKAGECALLDCRQGYGHATGAHPWRLRWIHFHGPSAPALYSRIRELAGFPAAVRATTPERYLAIWDAIWEATAGAGLPAALRANEGLAALFALLAEDGSASGPDYRAGRMAVVYDWIERHCSEDISLDDLAAMASLNRFSLSREFHAKYGVPPSRAIIKFRVTRAKKLLRFTDETVGAIGAKCGIDDPNYFARIFRSVEGLSPTAFRRQWREKN